MQAYQPACEGLVVSGSIRRKLGQARFLHEFERRTNFDCALNRARNWAVLRMDFMNSLNRLPLVRRRFEPVAHVNALDHKHVSFKLNFSGGLRSQLVVASVDVGASSA